MRRYVGPITLFLSAVALASAGASGVSPGVTSPVEGSFRYCSDPTFPPMESTTTSGQPTGFDIDLANAIGKLWRVKASLVQTAFPGLLPGLASKRCNMVISAIFVTPDRVRRFPAVGYMKTHRALVVKAGNPKRIKGPNDLSGKIVAVQAGTKYEEYLQALNDRFRSSGRVAVHAAELSGRHRRGGAAPDRPRRCRAHPGHVGRLPEEAASGQAAASPTCFRRPIRSGSTTAAPTRRSARRSGPRSRR